MKLRGADIFVECLKEQGVDTIFGYPGGAVLNIYDALYKAKDSIRHILTSHEQGAAHAADGYARASGKVGVCLATSGPGATNLVTGIATAYMDSVPMVAFTGQVPTNLLGKDSFQEVDITGITMPITKHNYIVKDVNKLAETIRKAFFIASHGRPGPVLVDICKDVTSAFAEYSAQSSETISVQGIKKYKDVDFTQILECADAISRAQRPFIIAGGGVGIADASDCLIALAERASIPVATTLMGIGSFPGEHPLFTGMVGMHGTKASNIAVSEADLIIAVGARFSDRVISNVSKFAPNAVIMHIDIDPSEIGKNVTAELSLVGDINYILKQLAENVESNQRKEWNTKISEWKNKYPLRYKNDEVLRGPYVVDKIYNITKGEAIITTEVGQNQIWAAQFYKFTKPRQFISSGGLGTMGFGLGASIGARIACPNKKVINIAGDGSFRMNCNELATAVEYKLPVIIAILNNRALGMVRQWQNLFYDGRYSCTNLDRCTDFVALAKAYGADGMHVYDKNEVDRALEKALSTTDRPFVINFNIDMDDKVLPIVPPGAPIEELIEE